MQKTQNLFFAKGDIIEAEGWVMECVEAGPDVEDCRFRLIRRNCADPLQLQKDWFRSTRVVP